MKQLILVQMLQLINNQNIQISQIAQINQIIFITAAFHSKTLIYILLYKEIKHFQSPALNAQIFDPGAFSRKKGETVVSCKTNGDELYERSNIDNTIQQPTVLEKIEPRKLMLAINLLVNVKGFYRRVTQNSRILEKLTRDQHNYIGDLSSFYTKDQFNKQKINLSKISCICIQVYQYLDIILQYIPIFAPYSIFKQIWDLIQAILEMIVSFLFSLYIFFQLDVDNYSNLFLLCFSFFFCDVFMNFNTGILQEGSVIYNRKAIAVQYIKGNFFFDIIGLLPFMNYFWVGGVAYSSQDVNSIILSCLISMKWFSLSENFSKLSFFLSYQKGMKNSLDLAKLIFLMLCVCHTFSLVWHGIAIYETNVLNREDSWLHQYELIHTDVWNRYLYSFYYLTVTMTTTGYGDICPKNSIEVVFAIVIIFTTSIFWAFFLNKIGQFIDNMEGKNKQYKETMLAIHRLMREEQVDKELRVKISNYLKYIYTETNEAQKLKEKEIIEKLSKQLRDDLILNMNGKYISHIPILDKLQQKNKIAQVMEECLFSPGEYIFKQNQIDDNSLYYIVKGQVSLIFEPDNLKRKGNALQILSKEQYFGEIGFLFQSKRSFSARANNFCRLYKLSRGVFNNIIRDSDHDFENFEMIKESILMKDNYKFQQIRCYTCNQGNHLAQNCPKTHLTISKQVHINRYNYTVPQVNRSQHMRQGRKQNCYSMYHQSKNAIFQINDNQELFNYLEEIEAGLNLTEQSDAYMSEQEFQSEHEQLYESGQQIQIARQSTKYGEDVSISVSQIEYPTLQQQRSLAKKSTANSVPLQPCRQSEDYSQVVQITANVPSIDKISEKQKEESILTESSEDSSRSQSSSSQSSQASKSSNTQQTNTNKDSLTQSNQKFNKQASIQIGQMKGQSGMTVVRGNSKKLSHNVLSEQISQTFKAPSSIVPVTVYPPTFGDNQNDFNNNPNRKNLTENQSNPLKDNDIQTIGGGTHIGSLTSITSRSRVPSRLAVINEKEIKKPANNSFIDTNFAFNDPIRSLTRISNNSHNKDRQIQNQQHHHNNQQPPNYQNQNQNIPKYQPSQGGRNIEAQINKRGKPRDRERNRVELLQNNSLQMQLQEIVNIFQKTAIIKQKKGKQDQPKQNLRQRNTVTHEKLQSQLKTLQNQKTSHTTHSNQKNLVVGNNNNQNNAQMMDEQIISALKIELDNQQQHVEVNEEEERDETYKKMLREFEKAHIYKYYHKNDNYILVIERWQVYWNKLNEILAKKKKNRKKKVKSRFKSKNFAK